MYGFLNAAEDTQWIRIKPPGFSIDEQPDPFGIEVTLENLETGEQVVMNDSLFTSKNFLNYWTTMDIENEQTYRIKAVRSDGNSSQVTVTIPQELPVPMVFTQNAPWGATIFISDGAGNIADFKSIWYVMVDPDGVRQKRTYKFSYRNSLQHYENYGGSFGTFISFGDERNQVQDNGGNNTEVLQRQFYAAWAGPEWNDSLTLVDDYEYFLNDNNSNVENGLGYVVGIDSKWFPVGTCLTPDSSNFIPCPPEKKYW